MAIAFAVPLSLLAFLLVWGGKQHHDLFLPLSIAAVLVLSWLGALLIRILVPAPLREE